MYGHDKYDRLFIAMKYIYQGYEKVVTLFQRYSNDTHLFCTGTCYLNSEPFSIRIVEDEQWKIVKDMIEKKRDIGYISL